MTQDSGKCLIPCKGIYADVFKEIEGISVDYMIKFVELIGNYESYKRGYVKDINFPKQLKRKN